jgi:hypothetical protein
MAAGSHHIFKTKVSRGAPPSACHRRQESDLKTARSVRRSKDGHQTPYLKGCWAAFDGLFGKATESSPQKPTQREIPALLVS